MTLMRLLTWIRMYQRKALLDHLPTIMIVYGYTPDRKISMENIDRSKWFTTSLCENKIRSSPKERVPDLSVLVVVLDVMIVLDFSTHTVLIGTSMMPLGRTPVLWWYRTRLTTDRGVLLSANGSMSRFWNYSPVSVMPGTSCLPNVCSRCCAVSHVISCRNWCLHSAGCVFIYFPFGGWRLLAWYHSKEEMSWNELYYVRAQVGLLFPIHFEH